MVAAIGLLAACSSDSGWSGSATSLPATAQSTPAETDAAAEPATTVSSEIPAEPAEFRLQPSVEQLYVIGAPPGTPVETVPSTRCSVSAGITRP